MATLLQMKNLLHIKATLSFHQIHTAFNSQPSKVLQTPPVFTFASSPHVFSCLRTICPITLVMRLTHPSFLSSGSSGLWLSYTHPGWWHIREHWKNTSSCQCPLTWFPCSGLKILHLLSYPRATGVLHWWCLRAKYFDRCSLMGTTVECVLSEVYSYCSCPVEQELESKMVLIGFGKNVKTKEVVIHPMPQRKARNPGPPNDTGWGKRNSLIWGRKAINSLLLGCY